MKKSMFFPVAAMILCLLLSLTACGQKPDVTIDQMLEANTNKTIFETYESALITQQYSNREVLIYRTKDFTCHTLGDGYYEANLNGRSYCASNEGYYAAIACFPMDNPMAEQIVFSEDLTQNETLMDVKKDGDHLVVTTQMLPEKVPETMEYYGLAHEAGAAITYEYQLDAKTLLFRQSTMSITDEQGNLLDTCEVTLQTNVPMPENIQALYDRLTAEPQKELTVVLNPGTAEEEVHPATALEGDPIYVLLPEGYTTFYTDPECTEVLAVTDGGAYFSRTGTVYSVKDTPILEKITEANQLDAMLSDLQQVGRKEDWYDAQGNVLGWYYYADENLRVTETDADIIIQQDGKVFGFDNEEKRPFIALFLDNARKGLPSDSFSYSPLPEEQVLSRTENHGELEVQTSVEEPETLDAYQQVLLQFGYEDTQLERICYHYTLDAATYRIKRADLLAERADGSTLLLMSATWFLDETNPYVIDEQMLDMLFSQDQRQVTVIADPGTDGETEYTARVGKGCMVRIYNSQEHPNLYLDSEFTQPTESIDDYESDLLLYTVCAEKDPLYNQTEEMQPYPEEEQCPACDTWYEAGTVHNCEIKPYPEEEQCHACGAWYELGTTHTCTK